MQVEDRSPREAVEEFGTSEDSVRRWVQQSKRVEAAGRAGPVMANCAVLVMHRSRAYPG